SVGDVMSGSPAWKLQTLVSKWFLGTDHPAVPQGLTYRSMSGNVFATNGPSYADVDQGGAADCWLLSSLATTACREPGIIRNMFTDNGNDTYTVRFFFGASPVYVTVDNQVPTTAFGTINYAKELNNVMWVALAEKAYAQLNEFSSNITESPLV